MDHRGRRKEKETMDAKAKESKLEGGESSGDPTKAMQRGGKATGTRLVASLMSGHKEHPQLDSPKTGKRRKIRGKTRLLNT